MIERCRECGDDVLWVASLAGKRMRLDARPNFSRGTYFIIAAKGESGSRLAVHVSHLEDRTREHGEKAGMLLYRPHHHHKRPAV